MNSLDSPGYSHDYLSQELVLSKEAQKVKILNDIAALIDRGGIEDESDRGIVDGAIAFIKNPTEELSIIMSKTTILGQVLGGYLMQGADIPPEIDAIHGYFLGLQCISKIKLIEVELLKGDPDSVKIQGAMARGLDWAKTLSKGYNDNTFLDAFNELQDNIGKL
jgi:hypothetical protein